MTSLWSAEIPPENSNQNLSTLRGEYLVGKKPGLTVPGKRIIERTLKLSKISEKEDNMGFIKNLFNQQGPGKIPALKGEYLGQKKPGLIPEIFAPGIVSTNLVEGTITFSPDGKEFYFTRWNHLKKGSLNTIWMGKMENDHWTAPQVAPFSGKYFDYESHISPDGKRLYFGSTRPFEGSGPPIEEHEWVLEKTAAGWSEPKPLGSPFKERFVMYATESKNRNIYFSGLRKNSNYCEICVSRWIDGKYQEPETLDRETVNRFPHTAHPYIAPDESYLIFDAMVTSKSLSNLYICFRKKDGTWTKAQRMDSKTNIRDHEMCATVSPDGKYLFFSCGPNIYWVDAKILERYKKE
jgi:hypothetical protein